MKTLLYFVKTRDFSNRCFNPYYGINQLRLSNVLFKNELVLSDSSFRKNFRRPYLCSASFCRSENLSRRCFSVKVDTKIAGSTLPEKNDQTTQPAEETKLDVPVVKEVRNNYNALQSNGLNTEGAPLLIKELRIMAKSTYRDNERIMEICKRLHAMELDISVKASVELLYYLSVLNSPHKPLLSIILKNITEGINEIYKPAPLITNTVRSLSALLIRDTLLLDAVLNWYISKLDTVDLSTAGESIHSLAVLNYYPVKADILLKALAKSKPVDYSSNIKFLNFVWSLVLLDRAEPDLIQSSLLTKYRKKLEATLGPEARLPIYLKLNNIFGYAKMRNLPVKVESGLYTSDTPWLFRLRERRQKDPAVRNVVDALINLLPPRTYKTFVLYESGCILDAVCYFDEKHNPEMEISFVRSKKGTELVIQFLGYRDLCFPDKATPTGIVMFHKNYLETAGSKVLFIPYNEFPMSGSLKAKTEYLTSKIQTILPHFSITECFFSDSNFSNKNNKFGEEGSIINGKSQVRDISCYLPTRTGTVG